MKNKGFLFYSNLYNSFSFNILLYFNHCYRLLNWNKENNNHNVLILSSEISRHYLSSSYHLYSLRAAMRTFYFSADIRSSVTCPPCLHWFTKSFRMVFFLLVCLFSIFCCWLFRNILYYLDLCLKDIKYLQIYVTLCPFTKLNTE